MADEPKVVPSRNNFKPEPVFIKASIADQSGARPGYVRQWVNAKNPDHPNYYEKYTREQFVGDQDVGYCRADPWTFVERRSAKQGRKRDDDTAGIETAQTHGDLVLIETTEENARIFQKYKDLKVASRARALGAGESDTQHADNGGRASYRARVGQGTVAEDPRALLNQ